MYLREFSLNAVSRGLLVLSTFGFTLLSARTYSGGELDRIVLFQLAINITVAFSSLGLHDVLMREAAKLRDQEEGRWILVSTLAVTLGISLAVIAVDRVLSRVVDLPSWISLGLFSGVLFSQIRLIIAVFRGLGRARVYITLQALFLGAPYLFGMAYLASTPDPPTESVLLIMSGMFAICALGAWLVLIHLLRPETRPRGALFDGTRRILREGKPLYAQSLIGVLTYNADTALLGAVAREGVVGTYAVVSRLVNTVGLFREVLAVTVLPNVVRFLARNDYASLERYTALLSRRVFVPVLVGILAAEIWAEPIMLFVFDGPAEGAVRFFYILMLSHVGFLLFGSTDHILIACHLERQVLIASLWSLAFFALFGPLAVAFTGALGLAVVVVIQRNLIFELGRRFLWRYRDLRIRPFGIITVHE